MAPTDLTPGNEPNQNAPLAMTRVASEFADAGRSGAASADTARLRWYTASAAWSAAIALAPAVLVVISRPDLFHIQNGMDPFVNVGYAQDLGTLLTRIGDRHYFVTRWTLYLPARLSFVMFGATPGYLVHHVALMALAVVPLAVWARNRWGVVSASCTYLVALCSPVLLRAVFTEYSTAVMVPCLAAAEVLLLASVDGRVRFARAIAVGALVAAAVIANPFAGAVSIVLLVTWGVWQTIERRRLPIVDALTILASGAAVVAFGLLWFRRRYGIDDVYGPTLDWVDAPSGAEVVRADDPGWVHSSLWIYVPLVLLASWIAVWLARQRRPPGYQLYAMTAMVATGLVMTWYQVRGSVIAMELHFYWCAQVPTMLIAIAIVVGELFGSARRFAIDAIVLLGVPVVIVAFVPLRPTWAHLPPALVTVPIGVALCLAAARPAIQRAAPAVLVAVALLMQMAAPPAPRKSGDGQWNQASYDAAFGGVPWGPADDPPAEQVSGFPWIATPPGRQGWGAFKAVSGFLDVIDRLEPATRSTMWLWAGGGWAWQMASSLGGSRSDRLVNAGGMGSEAGSMPVATLVQIESEHPAHIALLGTPTEVDEMQTGLAAASSGTVAEVLEDVIDPDGRPTAVRVVSIAPATPS